MPDNRVLDAILAGQKSAVLGDMPEENIVKAMLGSATRAVNVPGKVLRGEIDPLSDEGIQGAFDVASLGFTGGVGRAALAKPTVGQELGIFAGRRSATANQKALEEAIRMQSEGVPREQVLRDTGWFKNPSDKWAYEISDDQFKMRPNPNNRGMSLDKAIEHEALLAAYPDMKDVHVGRTLAGGGVSRTRTVSSPAGEVHVGMGPGRHVESSLMHELQHQIQAREGFIGGENPDRTVRLVIERMAKENTNDPASLAALGRYDALDSELQRRLRLNLYRRNAGEVEAATVQRRLGYTPKERRAIPPWKDYPVPEDKIIIPYRDINE